MWKDEDGKVYTEEELFNEGLEECHSEEGAYDYIDTLIVEMNFLLIGA
ncbi:hypothetical protein M0C40_04970 [Spiroplasma citri]|uniref:Uncharacterized protein n=2 Tax=Spiroplasma citri TaxID=2133 RepID=A0AAX3SWB8_SPICI|nr:hypothetical protein [Spiroplasma citri]WFG95451.1 hypothetical protein M0C40_04970 [Spiroplasma citri]